MAENKLIQGRLCPLTLLECPGFCANYEEFATDLNRETSEERETLLSLHEQAVMTNFLIEEAEEEGVALFKKLTLQEEEFILDPAPKNQCAALNRQAVIIKRFEGAS